MEQSEFQEGMTSVFQAGFKLGLHRARQEIVSNVNGHVLDLVKRGVIDPGAVEDTRELLLKLCNVKTY